MSGPTPGEAFAAAGIAGLRAAATAGLSYTHLPGRQVGEDGLADAAGLDAAAHGPVAALEPAGPPSAHEHDDESPAPRRNCPACKANAARTVAGPTGPDGPAWMAD